MLNIQRILFPTDFSDGARRAFPQAAYLADWHDAELHILNVTGRHSHDYGDDRKRFPLSADTLTDWMRRPAGKDAERPDLAQLPIVQKQVEGASPEERILAYLEDADIDLVVMGTHGRRGVDRMLFGSVTEDVVRRSACPVLTVRTEAEAAPGRAVRRVLVPMDFSEASRLALAHAKEIALTYGAEIDLLHVVEETVYPPAYGLEPAYFPTQEVVDRVEKQLGDMARDDIGYEHVMISATVGRPATEIIDYVKENEIDFLVIATHGRTGLDRVLFGSVAEEVIRRAPTPVFVVKPGRKSLLPAPKAQATSTGR